MTINGLPQISVAETLAERVAAVRPGVLPATTTRKCQDLLIDIVGLDGFESAYTRELVAATTAASAPRSDTCAR